MKTVALTISINKFIYNTGVLESKNNNLNRKATVSVVIVLVLKKV